VVEETIADASDVDNEKPWIDYDAIRAQKLNAAATAKEAARQARLRAAREARRRKLAELRRARERKKRQEAARLRAMQARIRAARDKLRRDAKARREAYLKKLRAIKDKVVRERERLSEERRREKERRERMKYKIALAKLKLKEDAARDEAARLRRLADAADKRKIAANKRKLALARQKYINSLIAKEKDPLPPVFKAQKKKKAAKKKAAKPTPIKVDKSSFGKKLKRAQRRLIKELRPALSLLGMGGNGRFCWKDSTKRKKWRAPNYCPPSRQKVKGKCYPRCPKGSFSKGLSCVFNCKKGYKLIGGMCTMTANKKVKVKQQTKARGAATAVQCSKGSSRVGGKQCYSNCPRGLEAKGKVCSVLCPPSLRRSCGFTCSAQRSCAGAMSSTRFSSFKWITKVFPTGTRKMMTDDRATNDRIAAEAFSALRVIVNKFIKQYQNGMFKRRDMVSAILRAIKSPTNRKIMETLLGDGGVVPKDKRASLRFIMGFAMPTCVEMAQADAMRAQFLREMSLKAAKAKAKAPPAKKAKVVNRTAFAPKKKPAKKAAPKKTPAKKPAASVVTPVVAPKPTAAPAVVSSPASAPSSPAKVVSH
jgi:hypothetical protein